MAQWGPYKPPATAAEERPRPTSRPSPKPRRSSGQAAYFGAAMIGAMLVFGSYYLFFHSRASEKVATTEAPATPSRNQTIGKIVVTERDSCTKKEFDNITGALKLAGDRSCEMPSISGQGGGAPQYQVPSNRLEQVRKGFLKQ